MSENDARPDIANAKNPSKVHGRVYGLAKNFGEETSVPGAADLRLKNLQNEGGYEKENVIKTSCNLKRATASRRQCQPPVSSIYIKWFVLTHGCYRPLFDPPNPGQIVVVISSVRLCLPYDSRYGVTSCRILVSKHPGRIPKTVPASSVAVNRAVLMRIGRFVLIVPMLR